MSSNQKLTPELHRRQIEAYIEEFPHYECYADALKRVLERACAPFLPQAIVQARPKSVSSFAEKCARKFGKYDDPARQLTDLCGARVIVQTLEQIKAVRLFVERNFEIKEREDKELLLSDDRFGYRDLHYLIRLRCDRAQAIGFESKEIETIGDRVAELQVRTMAEHAWADILHDRMYKAPLRLSAAARRTGALLGALMEDGDRTFDRLAVEIDTMVANYSAYASRKAVKDEIEVQELILSNEHDGNARAAVALRLARLLGPGGGHRRVVEILEPFAAIEGPQRAEVLVELGHALCREHRSAPGSLDHRRGQGMLEEVIRICTEDDLTVVPDLRRTSSLHARALSRLAWSWEAVPHGEGKALLHYRAALHREPGNPYHLANQIGFELFCHPGGALIDGIRPGLEQAVGVCREHALAGTELPFALFTAGRLSLLLGEGTAALGWYARGLQHVFDGDSCVLETILDDELDWIKRLHRGAARAPEEHDWIERLITLGRSARSARAHQAGAAGPPRVLVVAGGAGRMDAATLEKVRPCLRRALEHFRGMVVSGGTAAGIPGCAGEIAAGLRREGRKGFELVGYIPQHLPHDAPKAGGYDRFVVVSEDSRFSPGQILRTWEDLLDAGVMPDRVSVIGFGGGPLSAAEYHIGLALGATVGAVSGSGGAADAILADPVWHGARTLLALPLDLATVQAFVTPPAFAHSPETLLEMARAFHDHYVRDNPGKLPDNMRPWPDLTETYQRANLEQARYAIEILRAAGFDVRPAGGAAGAISSFESQELEADVERMAELEHGRWNVERLKEGWHPGEQRDNARRLHDCLRPWTELPDGIREYDRNGVRAFPEILARAGLEIFRVA